MAVALERGIATLLELDPETRARLPTLDGRVIRLCVTRPALTVVLAIVDERVDVLRCHDGAVDVTISGTLAGLRSLQGGRDALYTGAVTLDGDVGLAGQLSTIVAAIDVDIEEVMAPLVGGTLARKLRLMGDDVAAWLTRTGQSHESNTREYLVEESELLAPPSEVAHFGNDVDTLRAAVDRLEARLAQFEATVEPAPSLARERHGRS